MRGECGGLGWRAGAKGSPWGRGTLFPSTGPRGRRGVLPSRSRPCPGGTEGLWGPRFPSAGCRPRGVLKGLRPSSVTCSCPRGEVWGGGRWGGVGGGVGVCGRASRQAGEAEWQRPEAGRGSPPHPPFPGVSHLRSARPGDLGGVGPLRRVGAAAEGTAGVAVVSGRRDAGKRMLEAWSASKQTAKGVGQRAP